MNKARAWRDLAARLARMLEALSADDAVAAVAALEEMQGRARAVALARAIMASVAARPGSTSNTIAVAVRGDRALVLGKLRELERAGLLRFEPGRKGARLWYAAKTGKAYQPVRRCA